MVRPALVVVCLLVVAGTARAGELPRMCGLHPPSGPPMAMLDSDIDVVVRGPIVEATITQKFQNRTDHATEATYIFPLPEDAAVTAMAIKSGNRTYRASIEKREEAQRRYEDAVRAGVAGALLDQERPDVFTQTVAAIPPRGTVEVTLRFDTLARYQDGTWQLVLPMVVAPRYVPGTATNRPTTGTGRAPDTDRSPDASRVTPGGAPGAGGATQVTLHFEDKPLEIKSPTHELKLAGADVSFVDPRTDHDAVVRWKAKLPADGWVEPSPDGGYAAVMVSAPTAPTRKSSLRALLVLDRSAASRGDADALQRPLVRALVGALGAADRIAVTGSDQLAWSTPGDANRALEQLWEKPAPAFDLTRALATAKPDGAPIVLVTGGLVADDRAAIAAAAKLGVPVHVIGVGPAPARGLLTQIAAASGGTVRFAAPGDDLPALAKATLVDAATQPAPLTVTWGTLGASEVVPGMLPRLGAGQAMIVLARVKHAQIANIRANGDLFAIQTVSGGRTVDGATTKLGPLARRWARNRLEELISSKATARAITDHALKYGLVSPYTSLVAVGDEVVVQGGVRRSVAVPVSVPAGMKWQEVKRQTTVDTTTTGGEVANAKQPAVKEHDKDKLAAKPKPKLEPKEDKPAKNAEGKQTIAKKPADGRTPIKIDEPRRQNIPVPAKTAPQADVDARREPAPPPPPPPSPGAPVAGGTVTITDQAPTIDPSGTKKQERDFGDEDGEAEEAKLAPRTFATALGAQEDSMGEAIEIRSRRLIDRWRISPSVGGGLLRSQGDSSSLLSVGARLEYGLTRRNLVGVDANLWLVAGEDVAGQVLVSFARYGLFRHLELGAGAGLFLGNGAGPAASVSLRYHVPPKPRAAVYLRYDGALVTDEDIRRGQNSFTLGLEWGF
ncbi:MAG TPA: VIT and VWA domain-containing protein [Kofleriaceae bacterium]|nr:VIT and VWA domain-containing protein [Kofleriaceae bacterium]